MMEISLVIGAFIAGIVGIISGLVLDHVKRLRDNTRDKNLICQALLAEIRGNQNLIIDKKASLLQIVERSSPELARTDKETKRMFMETVRDIYHFERSVYAASCDKIGILGDDGVQVSLVGYYNDLQYIENLYPTTILALWEIIDKLYEKIRNVQKTMGEDPWTLKEIKSNKEKAKESQDRFIANFNDKADELSQIGEKLIEKLEGRT